MISTAVGDEQQINLAILNADKHSPASCARSTKRRVRGMLMSVELKAPTDRSRSDCVHEQVAKLGLVSRAAGMDCECPLYSEHKKIRYQLIPDSYAENGT